MLCWLGVKHNFPHPPTHTDKQSSGHNFLTEERMYLKRSIDDIWAEGSRFNSGAITFSKRNIEWDFELFVINELPLMNRVVEIYFVSSRSWSFVRLMEFEKFAFPSTWKSACSNVTQLTLFKWSKHWDVGLMCALFSQEREFCYRRTWKALFVTFNYNATVHSLFDYKTCVIRMVKVFEHILSV